MLLIDNILLAPVHGLLWVFNEIHKAALQERVNEKATLTARLSELYLMLERGEITDEEFNAAEKETLDRLDAIQDRASPLEMEDEEPETRRGEEEEDQQPLDQLESGER